MIITAYYSDTPLLLSNFSIFSYNFSLTEIEFFLRS